MMGNFHARTLCLLMLLCWATGPQAAASPVDGRPDAVSVGMEAVGDAAAMHGRFDVPASADLKETLYAVWLEDTAADPAPGIFLNGRRVDYSPVPLEGGVLAQLPPDGLQPRDNLLAVSGASSPRAVVFPLIGGFEEVHFEEAFLGDASKAAPPAHPNQALYDVQHYILELDLDMHSRFVDGRLTMEAKALEDGLGHFVLDLDFNNGQMGVDAVDAGPGTAPLSYTLNQASNWVIITLPETLDEGDTGTVRVSYSGIPDTSGRWGSPYRVETHGAANTPVVFTFSQPYGARKWWPCKDTPADKATMELYIRAPKPYYPMSNGELVEIIDEGDDHVFHWRENYPIATYLVAVTASEYVSGSVTYTALDGETEMDISHFVYPQNEDELQGLSGTLDIMEFFAGYFGEYPFLSEKYVNVTHNAGAGMEHQTASSMPPRNLFPDGKHRRNVHEVAHHWFGNLVTCETFEHIWLNEGWATYMEAMYYEYDVGPEAYHEYVANWIDIGIVDNVPIVNPNADAFQLGLVYRKAALVLHMLRRVMGEDDFYEAARQYLQAHAYGTVVTEDLIHHYEQVYGESLDWFFDQWVYGTGKPTYEWEWSTPEAGILSLTVTQTQSGQVFTMPIDIRLTALDGQVQEHTVFNDENPQTFELAVGEFDPFEVELDPDNWIYKETGDAADQPRLDLVRHAGNGELEVRWRGTGSADYSGFQLIRSRDTDEWQLVADSATLAGSDRQANVPAPPPGEAWYYQIRGLSEAGLPSPLSNSFGVRVPAAEQRLLVIDGYERWWRQNRGPYNHFPSWHGQGIDEYGASFETVSSYGVRQGHVALEDYDALVWVLGEESTQDETFSKLEQDLVRAYLRQGGQLFVSGAEIAWDLDWRGDAEDRQFYAEFLKASYVADDSGGEHDAFGVEGSIFAGDEFWFDDGSAGIYFVRWPDVINPEEGGVPALEYETAGVAAVQFEGLFPGGTEPGRLVNLGFPLETVYPPADRNRLLGIALEFFGIEQEDLLPGDFLLVH